MPSKYRSRGRLANAAGHGKATPETVTAWLTRQLVRHQRWLVKVNKCNHPKGRKWRKNMVSHIKHTLNVLQWLLKETIHAASYSPTRSDSHDSRSRIDCGESSYSDSNKSGSDCS